MDAAPQTDPESARGADDFAGRGVHLIGIGGSGMRALASMLLARGASVSGSDQVASGPVQRLAESGAAVAIGQSGGNIPDDAEIVVYSAAVHEQNPELIAARQRGLTVLKYAEMLGCLMDRHVGVAVAGTHGKSTTTGMVAWALREAGLDCSYVVGATVEQLGGPSGVGAGRHFVAEACEYDRSFLNLRPQYAAILNVEEDHLDCFADLDAIVEAFRAFASQVRGGGVLVVNGESREAIEASRTATCEVETFGLAEGCTWQGVNVTAEEGCRRFDVAYRGERVCRVELSLPGLHNAYNALAALALLHHAGVEPATAAGLLGRFTGTRRRMTLRHRDADLTVVDDFAHHPTEIQATLRAIRDHYEPERLICVFQPHQHSRTRFLLRDFASSFALATEVIVPDIYFVRDSDREKDYISSEDLVAQIRLNGGAAVYLRSFEDIIAYLRSALRGGDLVVTMGAGNIWEVADELVRRTGRDRTD